jgi:outer membrane lipoprotein carrier protein
MGVLLWLGASGVTNGAAEIVRGVEARYARAHTLEARFYERYHASGQPSQSESGIVYFSKPGRMRWEYESPQTKLFLDDGSNVWLYVPADRTASRAKVKESDDWRTPLALLTGKMRLNRLCGEISLAGRTAGASGGIGASGDGGVSDDGALDPRDTVLSCLPRPTASGEPPAFRQILFEVDPDYHLVRVRIREAGDVETEFRFGDWRDNVAVPESKFHFDPPPGVSVVNAEDLAAGMR